MVLTNPVPRQRLVALLAVAALIVAACGSDGDSASEPDAGDGNAAVDGEALATDADSAGGDDAESDSSEPQPLFDSTATDEPFATDGGATSSSDEVTIVDDNPRGGLQPQVEGATNAWPTDWSRQRVDVSNLELGIPSSDPRDIIPPIDRPRFEPIAAANWLDDREPGALVELDGEVRFYPLAILTRHEIVNDRFGDVPVIVTFCPLCNTAISFDARVDGRKLRFGVSGLLRNSDLVMWDDDTVTLWQQLTGEAIVGELAGTQLELISTSIVSYSDVLRNFPEARSLSRDTGFGIDYGANAYVGYSTSSSPFLFNGDPDPRFPALSRVVGVAVDDVNRAYPFVQLEAAGAINDEVADVPVVVLWGGDTADALDQQSIADSAAIGTAIAFDRRVGEEVLTFTPADNSTFTDAETSSTWTVLGFATDGPLAGERLRALNHRNEFWFAWAAFNPDATVYGG